MRAAIALALAACSDGATSDPGASTMLQIPGAQFRDGAFPDPSGGPPTDGAFLKKLRTPTGGVSERLDGALHEAAHAAIVGLEGYDGSWIVKAGAPDTETPDEASLHVLFGLSRELPPGPFTILVASADVDGRIGEPARVAGVAAEDRWPSGTLVIGLEWTGKADLDLHVIDPLGGEGYSGDPNTWEPPTNGDPVDPDAYKTGGILDHDGNARCTRDGIPSEHFAWSMPAPPGEYVVRVEVRSMCGDPSSDFYVSAYRDVAFDSDGTQIGDGARGYALPVDTQRPHGRGAGDTVLRFTLP